MKFALFILSISGIFGLLELHPFHLQESNYSWPEYQYDTLNNPLTPEKTYLGRVLFYDPVLSADSTISCASCHSQYSGFTHIDHSLSHGIGDSVGTRNAPVLINLVYQDKFMWDGAIHHLDVQALAPINNPLEMGETLANVVQKLKRIPSYQTLFLEAFGDTIVTGEYTLKALAAFMASLNSSHSKFDQVLSGKAVFTNQEKQGFELFEKHCISCHTAPVFSSGEFANNGIAPDPKIQDSGRMTVTQNSDDSLKFKIPTLRNIEFSFPYMHDGRFKTLREVLLHYSQLSEKQLWGLDPRLKDLSLSENEQTDLIAFLLTLTDQEFLFNKDFSFPFNFFYPSAKDH